MNVFKIFKKQLALNLIELDNRLIYTEPNHKYKKYIVFCFEDTYKLRKDLENINNK
ncbi:hypothetical protein [Clostridium perfringens]|jgi:hypothetical protein|uniref:Uncharacterized protein n=1 Tax=Clostridium perfringens TaxID=1502 RepID=A0AAW4IXP2_CLOPF|nr:hypothetical protein [Clostridium perfringens]MBO3356281.1 hypothetical protein [Clostridium perfringens]MBO3359378.1 hypothetical protein [Clostridium perfringens]